MTKDEPTVDELMAEIHEELLARPPEPSFPLLAFQELVPVLHEQAHVLSSPALIGRTAYERAWALINRTLRRGFRAAVEPVVAQQNEWNTTVEETLLEIAAMTAGLQAELSRLHAEGHDRHR